MKKKYIIFSIIIIAGVLACTITYVKGNIKEVSIEETMALMDNMPATDYERDLEKTKDLLTKYKTGEVYDKSDLATIKNTSKDFYTTQTINNDDENLKIKLSACYRAYKNETLNYDILCSKINSDISSLDIDLEGAKIYKSNNDALISKIKEAISICEKYLEKSKEDKSSNSNGVNNLYEEYDKVYTNLKDEIKKLS